MWMKKQIHKIKISPSHTYNSTLNYKSHTNVPKKLPKFVKNVVLHKVQDQRNHVTCDRFHKGLAIIVCIAIAGVFLSWAWKEFSRSPIEVNVETTNYPLYKLPFPAVTICPATNVKKTVGEKLLTRYLNLSINDNIQNITWDIMSGLSKCQYPFYFRMQNHFERVSNLFQHFTDFNITHFMIEVMPSCEEMFEYCFWLGQEVNCCDVFDLQRTEAGFCYSFNSLTSEKTRHCTSLDEFSEASQAELKEVTNVPRGCEPRHNIASGTTTGLEVFLKFSNPNDSLGLGQRDKNGFRVFFHHPSQFPESGKGLYVPEESAKVMQVKVVTSVTESGPGVKALSVSKRWCLFPDEAHISVFHTYSQENCLLECRLKNMAEMCGCHPYFFSELSDAPECNISQLYCLSQNNLKLRTFRPPRGARGFEKINAIDCEKCLPTCHNTLYSLDYSFTADCNPRASNQAAYLDVYYRDLGAIKYRQRLAFNFMDLVVSFGGVVSLFLGVSVLSSFQFLYEFIKRSVLFLHNIGSQNYNKYKQRCQK